MLLRGGCDAVLVERFEIKMQLTDEWVVSSLFQFYQHLILRDRCVLQFATFESVTLRFRWLFRCFGELIARDGRTVRLETRSPLAPRFGLRLGTCGVPRSPAPRLGGGGGGGVVCVCVCVCVGPWGGMPI